VLLLIQGTAEDHCLNSVGHVIGINTAVAQNGQNVGFALPINTVKDSFGLTLIKMANLPVRILALPTKLYPETVHY